MVNESGAVARIWRRFDEEMVEMAVAMWRMQHSINGATVAAVQKHKEKIRKKRRWRGRLDGTRNIERGESAWANKYLDEKLGYGLASFEEYLEFHATCSKIPRRPNAEQIRFLENPVHCCAEKLY